MTGHPLELTLALGDYAHARTLHDGALLESPGGPVRLRRVMGRPGALFRDALAGEQGPEVTEMSLATTYVLADREDPRYLALPVFPSRMFRHSAFYVGRPGMTPDDLRGGRIGVVRYGMTAAVWARGLLEELGVDPAGMTWWVGEEQFFAAGGVTLQVAKGQAGLEAMLLAGELDCLFSVSEPAALRDGRVHRLFPDFDAVERAALARTGIHPIMHAVLVRRDVATAHPWLPAWLLAQFEAAKAEALHWLLDTDASALPLPFHHGWAHGAAPLLGSDPWPYGTAPNAPVLEAFAALMHRQGLTSRMLSPGHVFGA